MTNMTDAEISKQLALAIGWCTVVTNGPDGCWVMTPWARSFDYRDPAVIWPIAERFDCFPVQANHYKGRGWIVLPGTTDNVQKTAAKAVAFSVIKAKEQK